VELYLIAKELIKIKNIIDAWNTRLRLLLFIVDVRSIELEI
jgi:hypothetical protein